MHAVTHKSTYKTGTETAVDVDKNRENLGESVEAGKVPQTVVCENSHEADTDKAQVQEVQENLGESVEAVRSVQKKKQRGQVNRDDNKLGT